MSEGKTKSDMITIKKDTLWKYSTVVLGVALILVVAFAILPGKSTTGAVVGTQPGNNLPSAGAEVAVEINNDDYYLKGDSDSEITILEYSDFECPFCGRAYNDAVKGIKQNYKDNEVAIVYRHFPLNSIHPNAQKSAEASECAGEQGKFAEMHDILFESGVQGGTATYKGYASQLGLDTTKFNKCLDDGKYAKKVDAQLQLGASQGIQGTPGFFVIGKNGKGTPVSGAQPFSVFEQIIDSKLS